MVRVDRLYLGPMSAPDQLGSDQIMVHRLKLGRELLPAPGSPLFEGLLRLTYRILLETLTQ
jgi:hypothetical protein